MRLYYEEDGKKMYLNVSYWSFLKCYFLSYLGVSAIIFAVVFSLVFIGSFIQQVLISF